MKRLGVIPIIVILVWVALIIASSRFGLDLPGTVGNEHTDEREFKNLIVQYGKPYEFERVVWVIDRSGSMKNKGEWDVAKREVRRALSEISDGTPFGIVAFAERVEQFPGSGLALKNRSTRERASNWLEQPDEKDKQTCIRDALETGVGKFQTRLRGNVLIYVGDGGGNCEAVMGAFTRAKEEAYLKATLGIVTNKNRGKANARIHTIGVLDVRRVGRDFLRRLASANNGGTYREIRR